MVRVAVTGVSGRMGRELLAAARERDDVSVVLAVSESEPGTEIAGHDVASAREFATLLEAREPQVVVDFTAPEASVEYAAACADASVALVCGTTGFDDDGEAALDAAAESVPVLRAANFARGVQALLRAVREAVAALPGYDVELIETHHNGKRDAPSGTAKAVLDAVDAAEESRVYGREGEAPREPGEVGVHAVRAGDVTGIHELLVAGNHEELRLTHRAEDRGVFAEGALDAAAWVAGADPGRYDFEDVLEGSA